MAATIKIDVQDLTPQWVNKIQKIYQKASLEITVVEPSTIEKEMNEARFWQIIDALDWLKGSDSSAILQPAINQLKEYKTQQIYAFQDILAQKLYALDSRDFASQIENGSETHFSVDTFLYARACVVANGKEYYNDVLEGRKKMPKEFTFEPILYLAAKAFELKTGKEWSYLPTLSYETRSNPDGWDGKTWLDDLLK